MTMTVTQKRIMKQLDSGKPITGEMINELILDHVNIKTRTFGLYERYKASQMYTPIFSREFDGENKINNKINNDFFSEIINVKLGYIIGKPIVYNIDKNKYITTNSTNTDTIINPTYNEHRNVISDIKIRNNFVDIDAELVKLVSICGHAGREIFIDEDGEIRVVNLKAWETIFLTNTFGEVKYALRYFPEETESGTITNVEFIDSEKTLYFEGEDETYEYKEEKEHLFGICPVIKVVNNEEEIGDCEKVLPLIDGYDRTFSDINSEIEQFRLAYMYFKGKEPTPEIIENAKKTGGFYVGTDGEVGFITKQIDDAVVEHHLDRMEDNILRFAQSVNFNDDAFANNLSGVAMRYKLFALESKTSVMETKLQAGLRQQFKIICKILNLENVAINYLDLFFDFTRNIEVNEQDLVQANQGLVGLVSERTRLSRLPFVDDVDYEIEQMQAERLDELNSYDDGEDDNNDSEGDGVNEG